MKQRLPEPFQRGQRRYLADDLEKMRAMLEAVHAGENIQAGTGVYKRVHNGTVVLSTRRGRGPVGSSGPGLMMTLHIGPLTTEDPYPTPEEMTEAIEAAIDGNNPQRGDIVVLTRDSGNVVAAKFTLIAAAGDGEPSNIGLWLRTVTEGEGDDEVTFRAVGGQTGAYA